MSTPLMCGSGRIFSNIEGDDPVRILPHFDHSLIRDHPTFLLGFSGTIQHLAF